jgi:hypothetical protein
MQNTKGHPTSCVHKGGEPRSFTIAPAADRRHSLKATMIPYEKNLDELWHVRTSELNPDNQVKRLRHSARLYGSLASGALSEGFPRTITGEDILQS